MNFFKNMFSGGTNFIFGSPQRKNSLLELLLESTEQLKDAVLLIKRQQKTIDDQNIHMEKQNKLIREMLVEKQGTVDFLRTLVKKKDNNE